MTFVESADHDVTIPDLFHYQYRLRHEAEELRRLLEAPIAECMRAEIEDRLTRLE